MNFKHLHYFWVTARAGGVMRAGEQLHTTPQTLSGQIKLLEERLGCRLFRKSGRQLELTDDGRLALGYADDIFTLGAELESALRQPRSGVRALDFRVGVADSVAKSVAYRLLEPAMSMDEPVRLIGSEGKFPDLLAQLALQRLDLVIADEPLTRRISVKAFNHALGTSPMSFFCAPALKSRLQGEFPQCLHDAPMLIQGAASSVRQQLDGWLARQQIQPRIVGEFDDGALMTAFGREGRGVFMSPSVLEAETVAHYGVEVIGRSDELVEEFFAVSVERRITHPAVAAITQAARGRLFSA
ncbi:MAG: LysR family transcriptional regulator [Curvibacter sp. GWA2_64_110]|nr:MAG: LysR family transcriptional regulator [Curvibacter sp. GWA2_64_110]HCY15575.1 transcriptional activator NhaR [Curvibacter sp.]